MLVVFAICVTLWGDVKSSVKMLKVVLLHLGLSRRTVMASIDTRPTTGHWRPAEIDGHIVYRFAIVTDQIYFDYVSSP